MLFVHNGKANAYRHAYWNALDTAEFGAKVTKIFTDAHQWESGNHALETEMDFYNNVRERVIGSNHNLLNMKEKIYPLEPTYDFFYFIDTLITLIPLILLIVILYFVIKLYIKLMKYLDRKN